MLPEVGSTIVPPGCSSPEASAASIIRVAIRSFTEPPGLRYSTLASTSGPSASSRRRAGRGCARAAPAGCCRSGRGASSRTAPDLRLVARAVRPGACRVRRVAVVGKAGAARKLAAAAAYGGGGLSRAGRRPVRRAARRGQDRPQDDRRRRDDPVPDATGWYGRGRPARRSRSRCSATPAPPATASTGSRRPRARCCRRRGRAGPTAGSTCAPSAGWAPVRPTWAARSTVRCRSSPTSR